MVPSVLGYVIAESMGFLLAIRRSPADVAAPLAQNFPATEFLAEDAAAARQHGRTLVSGDARARPTYEAHGVRLRLTG